MSREESLKAFLNRLVQCDAQLAGQFLSLDSSDRAALLDCLDWDAPPNDLRLFELYSGLQNHIEAGRVKKPSL